jgi:predicted ABC-type ATPase
MQIKQLNQQPVQQGGHDIPKVTIRRRFDAGLKNFTR